MARYEDYAKKYAQKGTGIDDEIADAADNQAARETDNATTGFEMPDRFKDKSPEEIAASYVELERLNSRQAQNLGEMRSLVDTLATNNVAAVEQDAAAEPITAEEFYDNPVDTMNKAVSTHPAIQEVKALRGQIAKRDQDDAQSAFVSKHPDYVDITGDPAFQNWVVDSPTRLSLAQAADQYDFNAADALYSLYKAEKGLATAQSQVRTDKALKDASLESTTGHERPKSDVRFSRQKWLKTMTRAKQGDLEAQDYIHRNGAAYRVALGSGNVRD